jgi:signal transduction histidine kinase/HAMP domain-containing protein
MNSAPRLRDLPLRTQLMLAFALLCILTTAVSTITLTTLAGRRMHDGLRDKSVRYARQLQQQLQSVVAFDDHLTARELFNSLMLDSDIDGLAVYQADGTLIEGRGAHPGQLVSLTAEVRANTDHVLALAPVSAREGRVGRLYVSLTTRSIDELQRREAWLAAAVAGAVMLGALALASRTSRQITRRLVDIAAAADRMAGGDLTQTTLDDRAKDEIGALSQAFNVMVSELNRVSAEQRHQVLTERERVETLVSERTQALERSRETFRLIAESTNAIPFTLDLTHGSFPYIGAQGVVVTGIADTEWGNAGALEVIIPREQNHEIRQRFDQCIAGKFEFEATTTWTDGERAEMRWMGTCELTSEKKLLRGLMQNVTDLRRLERELIAAQKLESVGRLAAGVAHEINTPVQFVSDNVHFVRTSIVDISNVVQAYRALQAAAQTGDAASAAERAAAAEQAADLDYLLLNVPLALDGAVEGLGRIATIVRSMKEFAHPDQAQKTSADLDQAIRSTLVIAHNEYKYVAELDAEFGQLPLVECYLGEINQVILNLLINASHAIGDVVNGGSQLGKITVRTRRIGDEIEISIGDTGTGIPESARDKIFDPFFTTKEVGKGTGQGLAIARSVVVNKHAGTLRFETECGKGTTFFIRLPIAAPTALADAEQVA